jgi:hypothetical protein
MATQIEKNLKNSFAEVRKDIAEIKVQLFNLVERQEELAKMISKTKSKPKKSAKKKK